MGLTPKAVRVLGKLAPNSKVQGGQKLSRGYHQEQEGRVFKVKRCIKEPVNCRSGRANEKACDVTPVRGLKRKVGGLYQGPVLGYHLSKSFQNKGRWTKLGVKEY